MVPYVIFLVFSCSCLLLVRNCELAQQRLVSYVVVVLATLLSGLRGSVGTDTYSYHQMYLGAFEQDRSALYGRIEPLFAIIIDVMSNAGFSPYVFTFVISVLQGLLLCKLIAVLRRPGEFLAVYLAMFYLNFHFNILRAAVATLLFLLAFNFFLVARSSIKKYLYCVAAIGFHYSILIFVVPSIFLSARGIWVRLLAVCLLALGCVLIINNVEVAGKISYYTGALVESYDDRPETTFYVMLFLYSILFVSVFDLRWKSMALVLFLTWLVFRVLTHHYGLFSRFELVASIVYLFYAFQIALSGWRKQLRTSVSVALVFLWLSANFYNLYIENLSLVDPYGEVIENHSPYTPYKLFFE